MEGIRNMELIEKKNAVNGEKIRDANPTELSSKKQNEIKIDNPLNVVFLSRICPQKNLIGAIRCLRDIRFEVEFTIYGPKEDSGYWLKCKNELDKLPGNIHWSYKGDVPSEEVQQTLQKHDVFLLPTRSENYGHVIFEALSVGCIPVVSDQTPWKVINERKAGYTLPLTEDMGEFTDSLKAMHDMDQKQRNEMADRAVRIARDKVEQAKRETGYRKIFG